MRVVVDKIEEDFAVCEKKSKKMININLKYIPKGVKEGDVLKIEFGKIYVDSNRTISLENEINNIVKDLWE